MVMHPIGYLRSVFQFKNGTPRQPSLCSTARGSLTVEKSVFNNPEHALEGLEEFSHAWIVFIFHKNRPGHSKAKVKPPRLNGKRVGVFSTRSPYRPNAIGLTLARIERISGDTVFLSGIDMIDGTPILDIKPFIPQYDVPQCRGEKVSVLSDSTNCVAENDCDGLSSEASTVFDHIDHCEMLPEQEVKSQLSWSMQDKSFFITQQNGLSEICHPVGTKTCGKLGSYRDDNFATNPITAEHDATTFTQEYTRSFGHDAEEKELSTCDERKNNFAFRTGTDYVTLNKSEISVTVDMQQSAESGEQVTEWQDQSGGSSDTNRNCPGSTVTESHMPVTERNVSSAAHCLSGASDIQSIVSTASSTSVAQWLTSPPVVRLRVSFTQAAEAQLQNFGSKTTSNSYSDFKYNLDFLTGPEDIQTAIVSVLSEDPRSVYRREKCADALYFFTVDQVHVTCWFDENENRAEVVRVQPLSSVSKLRASNL